MRRWYDHFLEVKKRERGRKRDREEAEGEMCSNMENERSGKSNHV